MARLSITNKFWITIFLGIIGCVVSYIFMLIHTDGWFAHWKYLGVLPDKPLQFVWLEPASYEPQRLDFMIEMVSGRIYRYYSKTQTWTEVFAEHPNGQYYSDCHGYTNANLSKRAFPPLPTEILTCVKFDWSWEWFNDSDYLIALEDGTIWTRNYKTDPSLLGFVFWDPLTAIIVGWGFILLNRDINAKREYKEDKKQIISISIFGFGIIVLVFWCSRIISPIANSIGLAIFLVIINL